MRPSIRAVFGWANERFSAHWPGLFAIGFLATLIPVIRMVLEQGNRNAFHPYVGFGIAAVEELVLLLCTAAMILLVTEPEPTSASAALGAAFRAAPRLIVTRIVTGLVVLIPTFALAYATGGQRVGVLIFLVGVVMLPIGFICRLAFADAVIERTGPFVALRDAFRRGGVAGVGLTFGFAFVIVSLIEQCPPLIFVWIANAIFPPTAVPFNPFPTGALPPSIPGLPLQIPGRFGSGIPWEVLPLLRIALIPINGYVATLFAGAALDFADATPAAEPGIVHSESPYARGDWGP
jgi:hypothetical protein